VVVELPAARRHNEALESVREEALALRPDRVRRINVDIWAAAITVRGCVPKIAALRDEMAEKCGGLDLRQVDALERYALAVTQMHATYVTASRPQPRVRELTAQLKEIRSVMISDIRAAERHGIIRASFLENLSGKAGALHTLSDVFAMCSFVRNNWSALEGASAIKMAEIDTTEQLAEEAHTALARKPYERADLDQLADLRRRVFTLFFDAYDEARGASPTCGGSRVTRSRLRRRCFAIGAGTRLRNQSRSQRRSWRRHCHGRSRRRKVCRRDDSR